MMIEALFSQLYEYQMEKKKERIYGIFDGVKYPMLWNDLEDTTLEYDMLFVEEELREEMEEVAPFFVEFNFKNDVDMEQTKNLLGCYGNNGCIFISSSSGFTPLLKAMRELFYIYTPEGDKGFMRFYEPQIFTEFVAQKNDNVRNALFWEALCYWSEDPDHTNILKQYIKNSADSYRELSFDLNLGTKS